MFCFQDIRKLWRKWGQNELNFKRGWNHLKVKVQSLGIFCFRMPTHHGFWSRQRACDRVKMSCQGSQGLLWGWSNHWKFEGLKHMPSLPHRTFTKYWWTRPKVKSPILMAIRKQTLHREWACIKLTDTNSPYSSFLQNMCQIVRLTIYSWRLRN